MRVKEKSLQAVFRAQVWKRVVTYLLIGTLIGLGSSKLVQAQRLGIQEAQTKLSREATSGSGVILVEDPTVLDTKLPVEIRSAAGKSTGAFRIKQIKGNEITLDRLLGAPYSAGDLVIQRRQSAVTAGEALAAGLSQPDDFIFHTRSRSYAWKGVLLLGVTIAVIFIAVAAGGAIGSRGKKQSSDPSFSLAPSSLDFGSVQISNSADQAITIKNRGNKELTVNAISLSGKHFSLLQAPDVPFTIAPGVEAELTVRFQPVTPQK